MKNQLKELREEFDGLANSAKKFNESTKPIGQSLSSAFLPLAGISAALTGVLALSIRAFGGFERTLNTIKAVSGATASEMQAIKNSAIELGQATTFSNKEVADSYAELAKAGYTARESLAAIPALLRLGAAAGGDLATATEIISGSLKAFQLDTSQTGRFVDVLAQSANQSAADITDMGFAFKQIAPVAAFQQVKPLRSIYVYW